jgi:hypothetical protein
MLEPANFFWANLLRSRLSIAAPNMFPIGTRSEWRMDPNVVRLLPWLS